ncbi:hypothetical protein [Helicobacter muridarum]|nr:hypothetical protein [Helicobacter muridarum]
MLGKIILCTLILSSSAWAYRCSESSCIDQRLGIGGYYSTFTTLESL